MTPRTLLFATAALLAPALAHATYLTYGSLAAFQAAAGSVSTTTFDGLAPSGGSTYYGTTGLMIGGVTITSGDNQLYAISGNTSLQGVAGSGNLGTGDYMEGSYYNSSGGATAPTTFTPGAGVYTFGLNYRAYDQNPSDPANVDGTFDVSVNGGTAFSITSSALSNFMGIVSTVPLTSISITPTGGTPIWANAEFFHFDNMATGAGASATPEPSTWGLLTGGLLALGFRLRKRNN